MVMYYRRKLLLSILQKAKNKKLGKINLQKVLFLISQKQSTPCFDFVPYKSGCFSFQSNKDLEVLSRYYGLVDNCEKEWKLNSNEENYFNTLKEQDQESIHLIFENSNIEDTAQLTEQVYDNYPYFATHPEFTLAPTQARKHEQQKQRLEKNEKTLFSIGYEGSSIDAYLNRLIQNNVKLLCDVRKNASSMKYGFSKAQLSKYCKSLHINYIHIADLGIESKLRQNLNTQEDYHRLFEDYKSGLKKKDKALEHIKQLLAEHKRVALTCFEKDHQRCHRSSLMDYYNKHIEEVEDGHL